MSEGNRSKSKGSAFERKVARILGSWLYDDSKALYRSRGSGSLFTRASFSTEVGDISPIKTNIYFPFCVECKNREKGCSPESLIKKGVKSDLYKWFVRNEEDCREAKLFPLLIFKSNFVGEFVLFRRLGRLGIEEKPYQFPFSAFRFGVEDVLYLCFLDDFIFHIKGRNILKFLRKRGFKGYGF